MTPQQIKLVQDSWELVVPIAKDATSMFYNRLFELDPSLKALFKGDIEEQGKKLATILTTVVRGLSNFEKLESAVWQLGRRHVAYGVEFSQYNTVASALLWTLEQGLGDKFTPSVKDAWVAAYTALAGLMQQGASCPYANFWVWKQEMAV